MPRGDRTGPEGAGPMTGRAAGLCAGNDAPGYAAPGYGTGFGAGFGRRGGGRGWRNRFWAVGRQAWGWRPGWGAPSAPTPQQERSDLEAQASHLEGLLRSVRSRIEALSGSTERE